MKRSGIESGQKQSTLQKSYSKRLKKLVEKKFFTSYLPDLTFLNYHLLSSSLKNPLGGLTLKNHTEVEIDISKFFLQKQKIFFISEIK